MATQPTKDKIISSSWELLQELPLTEFSMRKLASRLGMTVSSLYYHFSSKEEIFNFLVEEGIKLLQNSIDIKTSKLESYIDKIKAIILIEIKIVVKYEDLIKILLNQFWGKEARNQKCQMHIYEYINRIEEIVKKGMKAGEIKQGNSQAIASEIYGLIFSALIYKLRNNGEIDIMELYKEFESTIIKGLK